MSKSEGGAGEVGGGEATTSFQSDSPMLAEEVEEQTKGNADAQVVAEPNKETQQVSTLNPKP